MEAEAAEPIELVVVGHYLEEVTPEVQELVHVLPSWVATSRLASSWTSREV